MRSVEEFKDKEIRLLSIIVEDVFSIYGIDNLHKEKSKIKKYILDNYDMDVFEKDIVDIFNGDSEEIINFLIEIEVDVLNKDRELEDAHFKLMDEIENGYILNNFLASNDDFYFKRNSKKIEIYASDTICAIEKIIITDYKISKGNIDDIEYCYIEDATFVKKRGYYYLTIQTEFESVVIRSNNIKCTLERYDATDYYCSLDPYKYLSYIAKQILITDSLNEQEKRIRKELEMLASITNEKIVNPETLIEVLEMYDFEYVTPLIDIPKVLIRELSKITYKDIYDHFYNLIKKSQSTYPSRNKIDVDLMDKIDIIMKDKGYTGSYPDYKKSEKTDKLRLIIAYQLPYVIFHTKMDYFVSFRNITKCDELFFLMNVGGAKEGVCNSSEELVFNNQGDSYAIKSSFMNVDCVEDNINTMVNFAELKNMSGFDKRIVNGVSRNSAATLFGKMFTYAGGIFAIFMTLITFLIELSVILDSKQMYLEIVSKTPWLLLFFAYWLLFGTVMGLLYAIMHFKETNKLEV